MRTLYKYEIDLKTGDITTGVIKDVMVTRKNFIVRTRSRDFDIQQGQYTLVENLDQVFVRREECVYASTLNPNNPTLCAKLKEEAIKYIDIQIDFTRQRLRNYEDLRKEIIQNVIL